MSANLVLTNKLQTEKLTTENTPKYTKQTVLRHEKHAKHTE